jgi:hypothetical protein
MSSAASELRCDAPLYLDTFRPREFVSARHREAASQHIVPALLTALSRSGLAAHVTHELRYVAAIKKHSGGDMRLVKLNDPRFHPEASAADANVLVLARDGIAVGCVASRLAWCEHTLGEEMESGRFWVSDVETMWSPEDRCVVNASTARTIRACHVVYGGSIYLEPSLRGGTVLSAMMRLHVLWVLCHWQWSWAMSLLEPRFLGHAFGVYGVQSMEPGVWRTREGDNELHGYFMALSERAFRADAYFDPDTADPSRPMGGFPAPYKSPHGALGRG